MELRNLPAVDEILNDQRIIKLKLAYGHQVVVTAVRMEMESVRQRIKKGENFPGREDLKEQIILAAAHYVIKLLQGGLQRVINATGVVLHTNLGRAVLPASVGDQIKLLAQSYTNLELDLEEGTRGSRYVHVEPLLKMLTGCEACLVVNNNAAAVLLALNTMAAGREVIVSRGQLVEIGGSFRIPEIMKMSGAELVEVGTTNKTYRSDYEQAISESTAMLLSVHTSNYRIVGFTHAVGLEELNQIGQERGLPVMHDLGSGSLVNLSQWGLEFEPTVPHCLAKGADVVTFSGDKLLGGPQAGIIAGKKEYIEKMKVNHLLRALRVDKMTIAALEATLAIYLTREPAKKIPVLNMLTQNPQNLKTRAEELAQLINTAVLDLSETNQIKVIEVVDRVGGGAYPVQDLPGYAVEVQTIEAAKSARKLRQMNPAVMVRIKDNSLVFSVRTLLPGDEIILPELVRNSMEEVND